MFITQYVTRSACGCGARPYQSAHGNDLARENPSMYYLVKSLETMGTHYNLNLNLNSGRQNTVIVVVVGVVVVVVVVVVAVAVLVFWLRSLQLLKW